MSIFPYWHPQKSLQALHAQLPALFVFSLVWSIGATCTTAGRAQFNARLLELIARHPDTRQSEMVAPPPSGPVTSPNPHHRHRTLAPAGEFGSSASLLSAPFHGFPFPLPSDVSVYDVVFDRKAGAWVSWMQWSEANEKKQHRHVHGLADVFIPNKDSTRYKFVMKALISVSCVCVCSVCECACVCACYWSDPAHFLSIV